MKIISYEYYSTMLVTVGNEKECASKQVSTFLSDIVKNIPSFYEKFPQFTSIKVMDLRTKEILINHKKNA